LQQEAVTATTDARFFGLYGGIPTLVYGPKAEHIHGYDERVSLALPCLSPTGVASNPYKK